MSIWLLCISMSVDYLIIIMIIYCQNRWKCKIFVISKTFCYIHPWRCVYECKFGHTPAISIFGRGKMPALFFLFTASDPIQFYTNTILILLSTSQSNNYQKWCSTYLHSSYGSSNFIGTFLHELRVSPMSWCHSILIEILEQCGFLLRGELNTSCNN